MNFLRFLTNTTPDGYENIFAGDGSPAFLLIAFLIFMAVVYALVLALAIVAYVIQSIGLSRMLKKVKYDRPWFAWVPIVNAKAIGDLADMYDDGKPEQNFGKKLLQKGIITMALSLATSLISMVMTVLTTLGFPAMDSVITFMSSVSAVLSIAMIVFSVMYLIDFYKAIWRVYKLFSPNNATAFLILSIFVSYSQAIILFIIRGNEPQGLRGEAPTVGPEPVIGDSGYTYDPEKRDDE